MPDPVPSGMSQGAGENMCKTVQNTGITIMFFQGDKNREGGKYRHIKSTESGKGNVDICKACVKGSDMIMVTFQPHVSAYASDLTTCDIQSNIAGDGEETEVWR